TLACVKCDYCERRGHKWEDCPIRTSAPTVRLAAPQGANQSTRQNMEDTSYRTNFNRPSRTVYCWGCGKEGHFIRDCPDGPPNKQSKAQPSLNWVYPEVAAITRAQKRAEPDKITEEEEPLTQKWQQVKHQAAQVTQNLKKRKPDWQEP